MSRLLSIGIHVLVVLILPPLLIGMINRTKAWFAGRRGPPLLQAYYDLVKLMRKGAVFSETTTWVFRFGAVVGAATSIFAGMMIPLGQPVSPISFAGDLVLFAYVLGLGRFFTMAAALDTGSAFEGMGTAREATYACLAEPVMFFGLLVLAKLTDKLAMAEMLSGSLSRERSLAAAAMLLVTVSWFIVLLVENSRIPFDDPNTHLELTMIHEVMVLDHSGPAFGLILYGASIKLFVFVALLVRLAVPLETGLVPLDWVLFVASTLLVALLIGVVESVMARLRLVAIPNLLVGAGVLAAFGAILALTH